MARRLRVYAPGDEFILEKVYNLLSECRELLKQAGTPKTLARVRAAISSAKGARRHMATLKFITENPGLYSDRLPTRPE